MDHCSVLRLGSSYSVSGSNISVTLGGLTGGTAPARLSQRLISIRMVISPCLKHRWSEIHLSLHRRVVHLPRSVLTSTVTRSQVQVEQWNLAGTLTAAGVPTVTMGGLVPCHHQHHRTECIQMMKDLPLLLLMGGVLGSPSWIVPTILLGSVVPNFTRGTVTLGQYHSDYNWGDSSSRIHHGWVLYRKWYKHQHGSSETRNQTMPL